MDFYALIIAVAVTALVVTIVTLAAGIVWLFVQLLLRLTPSHRNPPPPVAPRYDEQYERYGRR